MHLQIGFEVQLLLDSHYDIAAIISAFTCAHLDLDIALHTFVILVTHVNGTVCGV